MEFTDKDYELIFEGMWELGNSNADIDSIIIGKSGDLNQERLARLICFFSEANVDGAYNFWKGSSFIKKNFRNTVTKGLAKFYPLSRPLLLKYFSREGMPDEGFYHGFDEGRIMINQLKEIIDEIKNQTKGKNLSEQLGKLKAANDELKKEIDSMNAKITDLQGEKERDTEYQKQKTELEKEINSLQKVNRDKEIKDLREKKRKVEADKKAENDLVDELKNEIGKYQERYKNNARFMGKLRGLLQDIPSDREDE